jgi:hypothetical protein
VQPLKVFECSDVAFKDLDLERKTRNERHFAAAWYAQSSGFEVVHGLLDRIMLMLDIAFKNSEKVKKNPKVNQYWIEELNGKYHVPLIIMTRMLIVSYFCRSDVLPRSRRVHSLYPGREIIRRGQFRCPPSNRTPQF